jgi:hypothetical protein
LVKGWKVGRLKVEGSQELKVERLKVGKLEVGNITFNL